MAVIPLVLGQTVVTTEQAFENAGGRQGRALLIRNFDVTQLRNDAPNLSYDLRVGAEYKDHRDGWKRDTSDDEHITLIPGGALIIETEESVHLPGAMFGYLVPRVKWLQEGVSNTLSKVDAGYNGHLLVTLFNLGKKTAIVPRRERFCSLVIHSVGADANVFLYDKGAKRISGPPRSDSVWRRVRDIIEAHPATVMLVLALATVGLILATTALAIVEFSHLHHAVIGPHGN
jgi:deoxycytidine triphosphate deaminase